MTDGDLNLALRLKRQTAKGHRGHFCAVFTCAATKNTRKHTVWLPHACVNIDKLASVRLCSPTQNNDPVAGTEPRCADDTLVASPAQPNNTPLSVAAVTTLTARPPKDYHRENCVRTRCESMMRKTRRWFPVS